MTNCETAVFWRVYCTELIILYMEHTGTSNAEEEYLQKAYVLNCGFVEWILIRKYVNVYQKLKNVTEVRLSWSPAMCFATVMRNIFFSPTDTSQSVVTSGRSSFIACSLVSSHSNVVSMLNPCCLRIVYCFILQIWSYSRFCLLI